MKERVLVVFVILNSNFILFEQQWSECMRYKSNTISISAIGGSICTNRG